MKPGWKTTEHWLTWAAVCVAAMIVLTAPWWYQKLAAVPAATIAVAIYNKGRNRLKTIERAAQAVESIIAPRGVPLGLVPYLDPVRGSTRTGQIIHQFVAAERPGADHMDAVTKFLADVAAKALKVTKPSTVASIETAAGLLVSAGLAVYAAIKAVEADKATK